MDFNELALKMHEENHGRLRRLQAPPRLHLPWGRPCEQFRIRHQRLQALRLHLLRRPLADRSPQRV